MNTLPSGRDTLPASLLKEGEAGSSNPQMAVECYVPSKRRRVLGREATVESSDSEMRDQDAGFDDDPEQDPGERLEAVIEQADHPLGSDSFGTTAEEGSRGESLDQRLAQERPSEAPTDAAVVIEDSDDPDDEGEMVGDASLEHDPFIAPEEAAVHVLDEEGGRDS